MPSPLVRQCWSPVATIAKPARGRVEEGSDRDFATLAPPGGGISPKNPDGRTTLPFQRIDDWIEPTWPGGVHPQQAHLDLSVPDIAAAEPQVVAAGARVHPHQPSKDGGFRVYLDPVGHPSASLATNDPRGRYRRGPKGP